MHGWNDFTLRNVNAVVSVRSLSRTCTDRDFCQYLSCAHATLEVQFGRRVLRLYSSQLTTMPTGEEKCTLLLHAAPSSVASINVDDQGRFSASESVANVGNVSAMVTVVFCEGDESGGHPSPVRLSADVDGLADGSTASSLVTSVTVGPLSQQTSQALVSAIQEFAHASVVATDLESHVSEHRTGKERRPAEFGHSTPLNLDTFNLALPVELNSGNAAAETLPPPGTLATGECRDNYNSSATARSPCGASNPYLALLDQGVTGPSEGNANRRSPRHHGRDRESLLSSDYNLDTGDDDGRQYFVGCTRVGDMAASSAAASVSSVDSDDRRNRRSFRQENGGNGGGSHRNSAVLASLNQSTYTGLLASPYRPSYQRVGRTGRNSRRGSADLTSVGRTSSERYADSVGAVPGSRHDEQDGEGSGGEEEDNAECVPPAWFPEAPDPNEDDYFRSTLSEPPCDAMRAGLPSSIPLPGETAAGATPPAFNSSPLPPVPLEPFSPTVVPPPRTSPVETASAAAAASALQQPNVTSSGAVPLAAPQLGRNGGPQSSSASPSRFSSGVGGEGLRGTAAAAVPDMGASVCRVSASATVPMPSCDARVDGDPSCTAAMPANNPEQQLLQNSRLPFQKEDPEHVEQRRDSHLHGFVSSSSGVTDSVNLDEILEPLVTTADLKRGAVACRTAPPRAATVALPAREVHGTLPFDPQRGPHRSPTTVAVSVFSRGDALRAAVNAPQAGSAVFSVTDTGNNNRREAVPLSQPDAGFPSDGDDGRAGRGLAAAAHRHGPFAGFTSPVLATREQSSGGSPPQGNKDAQTSELSPLPLQGDEGAAVTEPPLNGRLGLFFEDASLSEFTRKTDEEATITSIDT